MSSGSSPEDSHHRMSLIRLSHTATRLDKQSADKSTPGSMRLLSPNICRDQLKNCRCYFVHRMLGQFAVIVDQQNYRLIGRQIGVIASSCIAARRIKSSGPNSMRGPSSLRTALTAAQCESTLTRASLCHVRWFSKLPIVCNSPSSAGTKGSLLDQGQP